MHIETFLIKYCTTVIMLNFLKIVILMEQYYYSFVEIVFFSNKTIVLYHISRDCFPASFKALIKISAEKKWGHHAIFLIVQKKQAAVGSPRRVGNQTAKSVNFFKCFCPQALPWCPQFINSNIVLQKSFLGGQNTLGNLQKSLLIIEIIFCNATTHENIFFQILRKMYMSYIRYYFSISNKKIFVLYWLIFSFEKLNSGYFSLVLILQEAA